MRAIWTALLLSTLAACEQPPTLPGGLTPPVSEYMLEQHAEVAPGVPALPRIERMAPDAVPGAEAINARFAEIDAQRAREIRECLRSGGERASVDRTVDVTRSGPDYLAVDEYLDMYCGGAKPNHEIRTYTLSFADGSPLDWAALLPGLALTRRFEGDQSDFPQLTSPALRDLYRQARAADVAAAPECREVWMSDDLGFRAAFTGGRPTVTFTPELPSVIAACADPLELAYEDLRKVGAPRRLKASLEKTMRSVRR